MKMGKSVDVSMDIREMGELMLFVFFMNFMWDVR